MNISVGNNFAMIIATENCKRQTIFSGEYQNIDKGILLKTTSWLLSGFTGNFDILQYADSGEININADLCRQCSRDYPEYSKIKLSSAWFQEFYMAKFLSVKVPSDCLKTYLYL